MAKKAFKKGNRLMPSINNNYLGFFLESLKFGYSEKATKFEKIFHLKFDATQKRQIISGIFFQILWPSQNIGTL